jgi:predicted dehydrogenase
MVLRLGLIGHGRWGRNIARTLLSWPDVSLTLVGRNAGKMDLDGILIATPSATHAEIALPYIEAGIATFIEKPMVTSLADALRIRDAAARSGAIVHVGHIYLHHPAFVAALDQMPALGPIRYILSEGANDSPRTDSSVLWDWLPHDLSMAMTVFGHAPDHVASWPLGGGDVSQAAVSRFQFAGQSLIATVSWLSPRRSRQMTIVGEQAALVFDGNAEHMLALYRAQDKVPSYPVYSAAQPLMQELDAFLRAIRAGLTDLSQVEMAIHVTRAVAAAEISLASGGSPVTI